VTMAQIAGRKLRRTKSESFKIAAKPLLQYMHTLGPLVAYATGFMIAFLMGCVPAISAENAQPMMSAWGGEGSTALHVQLYGCGLFMLTMQSHLIMAQMLLQSKGSGRQLKSAKIVRKQTPAAAGFFAGTMVGFGAGVLPAPRDGQYIIDVSVPHEYRLLKHHCFASHS